MKARFCTGYSLVGLGIVLIFVGIFSVQPDIHMGIFGIPAIYLIEAGIVIGIAGLLIRPNRAARDVIVSQILGKKRNIETKDL